jgi:outer membrane receptor protein involved in Fe transport
MKKFLRNFAVLCLSTLLVMSAKAQNASTVSGTVKNSNTSESVAAVSVSLKGSNQGTYTDDKGNFKITITQKAPYILVFSSVGFESKEVTVDASNKVNVTLKPSFVLGSEVVVAASRVAERILESPVTIERISNSTIKNAPASNYYDILGNLKGVDVVAASLTFKSISTRGFNGSGNTRMNQLIDGMDNQAPGLNFSVGSIVGLTELDVDNIELLPGASSALYGAGGMNGTVLINSKSPFKYQGLSFQIKSGMNHVDGYERPKSGYSDYTVRWASKINDRFAYKISAESTEAQDWLAQNTNNYSRTTGTSLGQAIGGTRLTDPNYDGVNVYGDETTTPLSAVYDGVKSQVMTGLTAKYGALASTVYGQLYGAVGLFPTVGSYTAFLTSKDPTLTAAAPYLYGNAKGMFTGVDVSRTGYNEIDVIDPTTRNNKVSGSIHYKVSDQTEASFSAYTGTGNTVYTGSDRYSLKNLQMSQFKFELKSKNWYIRAYETIEDAGNSFNSTIATRLYNETWSPSKTVWYPTYTAAYVNYKDAGLSSQAAHSAARAIADANRPTGHIGSTAAFNALTSKAISQGGAQFVDKSTLAVVEGQINLTETLGLDKYNMDLLVGGSSKTYTLNSQGTLFADTAGKIGISETGAYAQLSKKFFGDVLKLTAAGRYDKNENFKGQFTPRFTAVIKVAEDNNLRVSYQTAYRFPTTQNQYINLTVGGGTRLMGGLQSLRDFYNFNTNPAYTAASVAAFGASYLAGAPNTALLQKQVFGEFKPESMSSFEVGYKTLIAKRLLIDFYAYSGTYTNFIGGVNVVQSRNALNPYGVLSADTRVGYSISTNATANVSTSGWGVSADYMLPGNFTFTSSLYTDNIGDLPVGFISYFNTPKWRANFGLSNSGFLLKKRLGFSASMHYQDELNYEGTFAVGKIASFNTIDAVLTYKVPSIKSLIKAGGTNIFNKYYYTAYGSPKIGGLYYVSFAYNIF